MARFRIEQPLVHVDVEHLGAVGDLVAGDLEGGVVVAGRDQLAEPGRAGDVGPLADIDEGGGARLRVGRSVGQTSVPSVQESASAVRQGTSGKWMDDFEFPKPLAVRHVLTDHVGASSGFGR